MTTAGRPGGKRIRNTAATDPADRRKRDKVPCSDTVSAAGPRSRIAMAANRAQVERDVLAGQPMLRLAGVDDIVPVIVYLRSDELTGG